MIDESGEKRLATKGQTWLLFCLTKKDYRDTGLTYEEADKLIKETKKAKDEAKDQKLANFEWILSEAIAAGDKALEECVPVPMVVQQHAQVLNDNSPVTKEWLVEGGVCGFAWVVITPGTTAFAKFLRKKGYKDSDYYSGGVTMHANGGGQSMERKVAWARAVAGVLQDNGIDASTRSRMD